MSRVLPDDNRWKVIPNREKSLSQGTEAGRPGGVGSHRGGAGNRFLAEDGKRNQWGRQVRYGDPSGQS